MVNTMGTGKVDNDISFGLICSHSTLREGTHLLRNLSQDKLLDLPRRCLRKFILENHRLRNHITRHLLPAVLYYVILTRFLFLLQPRLQAHKRARRLSPILVRPRHHRRLHHRWVPVQNRLHLHAAQVLAAADDHIL